MDLNPEDWLMERDASDEEEEDGEEGDEDEEGDQAEIEEIPDDQRTDFDITEPLNHTYLFKGDSIDVVSLEPLSPNQSHRLPYITVDSIVVPGQTIPIHRRCPFAAARLNHIIKNHTFVVLFANIENEDVHNAIRQPPFVATIAKVVKYTDQPIVVHNVAQLDCQLTGVYRCEVSGLLFDRHCLVTILPDIILPQITTSVLVPRYALMSNDKAMRRRVCANFFSQPDIMFRNRLEDNCEKIIDQLTILYKESSLRNILAMGESTFSFWVTANLSVSMEMKYKLLCEATTDIRVEMLAKLVQKLKYVNCKRCETMIFEVKDTVRMSADGFGNLYVNPGGHTHDLITALKISNFRYQGAPSAEFCWFPGYRWHILVCERCYSHIGWEYTSSTLKPKVFYGITRSSVQHAEIEAETEEEEVIVKES